MITVDLISLFSGMLLGGVAMILMLALWGINKGFKEAGRKGQVEDKMRDEIVQAMIKGVQVATNKAKGPSPVVKVPNPNGGGH